MASNPSWNSFSKEVAGENRTKIKNKYRMFIIFQLKMGLTRLTNIPFSLSYMARLKHIVFLSADTLTDHKFISVPEHGNLWILLPNPVIFQPNIGFLGYLTHLGVLKFLLPTRQKIQFLSINESFYPSVRKGNSVFLVNVCHICLIFH